MPLTKYYRGDGPEVMKGMQRRYGAKKGKSVFYATANKHGLTGQTKKKVKHRPKRKVKPNPDAPLGQGGRFAAVEASARASGARNPSAVAASIGRRKYGKRRFQNLSKKKR